MKTFKQIYDEAFENVNHLRSGNLEAIASDGCYVDGKYLSAEVTFKYIRKKEYWIYEFRVLLDGKQIGYKRGSIDEIEELYNWFQSWDREVESV